MNSLAQENVVGIMNKIGLAIGVKGNAKQSSDSPKWENIFFSSKAIKHMPNQITLWEIIYNEKGKSLHIMAYTGKFSKKKKPIFWKFSKTTDVLWKFTTKIALNE